MKIRDIMTEAPACCAPDTKLEDVTKLMLLHNCGEIPVIENDHLVGVVTDRDIACRGFAAGKNPLDVPARTIMTPNPHTVAGDADLDVALVLMEKFHVRRLPVLQGGNLVGIVSQTDLIPHLPNHKVARLVAGIARLPLPKMDVVPAP